MRVVYSYRAHDGAMVGLVNAGETTPWSWASLPGVGTVPYQTLHVGWWMTTERWPTVVCNQCGRSGPWHLFNLCEDAR